MKLSEFDLNWYAQWGITHEPLDEWSRPGLTNGLGAVQIPADPTSLRHVVFAPVSSAEESTGYLTLNGTFITATRTPTTLHWSPWAVERKCRFDQWDIHCKTSMAPGKHGLVQRITLTNRSEETRPLQVGLRLSGRCVNRGLEPWFWGIPKVELSVDALHGHSGLNPHIREIGDHGRVFQERTVHGAEPGTPIAFAGQAHNAQVLAPTPDAWAHSGDAQYSRELAAGESFTIDFALTLEKTEQAVNTAETLLAAIDTVFAGAEAQWRTLWKSAFSDEGPLGGRLHDLELPDSVAPVAVSGILSALYCRRTFADANHIPAYNISCPRRVEACFYPNDWALAGELLAEIEPEATWRQLEMALAADVRHNNQINLFTGKGGDYSGQPWPYTIDIFNCFYTAWELWRKGGASVEELSRRRLHLPTRELTLLEVMEDLAFDWRNRTVERFGLANYGPKEELLECVSTYEHIVAGLNAGAAWMLFELANIYRLLEREKDANKAEAEGQGIVDRILEHLYVEGTGYFRCLSPEGDPREVRTCWDFGMVGFCIGDRLPAHVQEAMTTFFKNELQTPGWLRALSPHDADAATSGFRADHQYNGAFGAWPAQCALGLIKMGQRELVAEWFEGIARTARQGPFAQAHYDEGVYPETHGGATKVTDEAPQCIHWCNLSGGLFWAAMKALYGKAESQ
jgi:hypothetical protein